MSFKLIMVLHNYRLWDKGQLENPNAQILFVKIDSKLNLLHRGKEEYETG